MIKKIAILFTLVLISCFKNYLIDRISDDYFPLNTGFRTKFLHLPFQDTTFIEVLKDTVIIGEECKIVSFFGERNFFKREYDYVKKYFKEVFYTGEEKYILEESFLPFIPAIFIDGETVSDSLNKIFLIRGDTVIYRRKVEIKTEGPLTFTIGEVDFENCFEVIRKFTVEVKSRIASYEKSENTYEIYTPLKGLIFRASQEDTFKYIGGR